MNCKYCGKPVVLVPSARERADKDVTGKSAKYYESLFAYHTECQLELRRVATSELMNRIMIG